MTELVRRTPIADLDRAQTRWLGGLSEHTKRGYDFDVKSWRAWCVEHGVNAGYPNGRDVVEHLAGLTHRDGTPLSQATKARRCSAIISFYQWAKDEGLTDLEPPEPPKAQRPRVKGMDAERLSGLSDGEAQRLMVVADDHSPRAAALVALLLTTGLRISEALGIDQLTHRPGRTTVTVLGKGRKTRTVVVPAFAAERVEALRALNDTRRASLVDKGPDDKALFISRNNRRLTPREAWDSIRRLGIRAGVPHLHPHLLRHTAATAALKDSNIEAVRAMLGHSSLGTTQRYVEAAGQLENSPAYALAARFAPREDSRSE